MANRPASGHRNDDVDPLAAVLHPPPPTSQSKQDFPKPSKLLGLDELSRDAKKTSASSHVVAWGASLSQTGWSSRAGFKDSITGEQISRAQAIAEIDKMQKESGLKVLARIEEAMPYFKHDTVARMELLEKIDQELDASRKLLQQHSKGLLGSDLAELRVMRTEKKTTLNNIDRNNRQNMKDLTELRSQFRHCDDECRAAIEEVVESLQEDDSSVASKEQHQLMRAVVCERLLKVFSKRSQDEGDAPLDADIKKETSKLENQFLKERIAALEKQVVQLTEQLMMSQRTTAILIAKKEKMEAFLAEYNPDDPSISNSNSASSEASNISPSPSGMIPQAPAGRPKAGQPKRASISRAGRAENSGQSGDSEA